MLIKVCIGVFVALFYMLIELCIGVFVGIFQMFIEVFIGVFVALFQMFIEVCIGVFVVLFQIFTQVVPTSWRRKFIHVFQQGLHMYVCNVQVLVKAFKLSISYIRKVRAYTPFMEHRIFIKTLLLIDGL